MLESSAALRKQQEIKTGSGAGQPAKNLFRGRGDTTINLSNLNNSKNLNQLLNVFSIVNYFLLPVSLEAIHQKRDGAIE